MTGMIAESTTETPAALPGHLSWSSLSTYRTCPKRFFFRYIAKVPEESRFAALVFGGAIHAAIERLNEGRMAGKGIADITIVLAEYERHWAESLPAGPPLTYSKGEDAQSLRELAGRMLAAYREHAATEDSEIVGIEHEAFASLTAGTPPFKARIDLVELRGRKLILTDFKTSRSRWNDDKARENLPQLLIYAHAMLPVLRELGAEKIVPRFVVLTKAKTPVVQIVTPQPATADVGRLRESVGEVWTAIKHNDSYPRREGWQCKQCPFSKRCLRPKAGTETTTKE